MNHTEILEKKHNNWFEKFSTGVQKLTQIGRKFEDSLLGIAEIEELKERKKKNEE